MKPVLYIFAGLPGSGKTTLARMLARQLRAAYLRIDTIEQGIRDQFGVPVTGEGYALSFGIAGDNLLLGVDVVADSCNPIQWTRDEWEKVARESGAGFRHLEIICSDNAEHRKRVETRGPTIAGLCLPTWAEVEEREYHEWDRPRVIIDTAGKTVECSCQEVFTSLGVL